MKHGHFVISLDFELFWGVRDKRSVEEYGDHVRGVHTIVPEILRIFRENGIHATWATVGFLWCENRGELLNSFPKVQPGYADPIYSPYGSYMNRIGENELDDPLHFAASLVRLIRESTGQEMGSHTFSHFYCLENGQTAEEFRADMQAADSVARKLEMNLQSLVFPRNQYSEEYLRIAREEGIMCYRGNGESWLYRPRSQNDERLFRRALRLLDAYMNVSGPLDYSNEYMRRGVLIDIPASRFLRPYSRKSSALQGLQMRRITSAMTHAARTGRTFHLWWHPHNFGVNQSENLNMLGQLIAHFKKLHAECGFESLTMGELATFLRAESNG